LVRARLRSPGYYLLIEDTSFLSFSHRGLQVPGLGPIGGSEDGQQGCLLPSVFSLAAPWPDPTAPAPARPPPDDPALPCPQSPACEARPAARARQAASRQRTERDRESQRWLDSGARIGPAPRAGAVRWVRVADREADIYEYLAKCREIGHGFVVRVMQDRVV